jgi:DNA-binding cell septation regulator SpoVG
MKIAIEHHNDQFNVALSSGEGKEPFLTIKGCRVVDGAKGRFISFPSRKLDSGKYWNHVYASEGFQAAILAELDKGQPKRRSRDDEPPF